MSIGKGKSDEDDRPVGDQIGIHVCSISLLIGQFHLKCQLLATSSAKARPILRPTKPTTLQSNAERGVLEAHVARPDKLC